MLDYQDEMKIINGCEYIEDKLEVFSLYVSMSIGIHEILVRMDEKMASHYRKLLCACLKVYIGSLEGKVGAKEFMHGFLKGVQVAEISKIPEINEILSCYEMPSSIKHQMPYVDKVRELKSGLESKERFIVNIRIFWSVVSSKIDFYLMNCLPVESMKRMLLDDLSSWINNAIEESNTYREFKVNLTDSLATSMLNLYRSGRIDYTWYLDAGVNELILSLDSTDKDIAAILYAYTISSMQNDKRSLHMFLRKNIEIGEKELQFRLARLEKQVVECITKKYEKKQK